MPIPPQHFAALPTCSLAALVGCLCLGFSAHSQDAQPRPQRVADGLQVLYELKAIDQGVLVDRAGQKEPIDLKAADPAAVKPADGGLTLVSKTLIRSEPATRLSEAIKKSGRITIEAWVRPADTSHSGPARIVTLSKNTNERNFTLGQEKDRFDVRLRTTNTSANGVPSLSSQPGSVKTEWTHLVFTFGEGQARLYVNGRLNAESQPGGDLSNWDESLPLALANELTGDRPWLGSLKLVALYSRDLLVGEVQQNFRAGAAPDPQGGAMLAERARARHFETKIAPLIAQHCLECHDTATKKGGLDLSRQESALAGGDRGAVIVPGKPAESRLWELVSANEMPRQREHLSESEKKLLEKWLADGATWSLATIDPAVYALSSGVQKVYVQRLTVPEYIETVRSTLGIEIDKEARELLPPDLRADGFKNTAYNLNVDLAHVEAYAKLAEIIVERIDVAALAKQYTGSSELTDENVTKVVEPLGKRLLRGPVEKPEVTLYCGISTSVAAAGGNFEEAIGTILEAMLQSPRFLYRIEGQHGDGSPRPLTQFELATRLSYILWGGPPDDELLAAAEKKSLDKAGVSAQVQRMLKDERAKRRSLQFASEWLALDRLATLQPNKEKFPDWDAALAADMRAETLAFFEEVVWKQNRPLSELLNAEVTVVTPRLAKHYGLKLDNPGKDDQSVRVDLKPVPARGGILTQGSTLTAGGDDASMVTRGLFVMHELLRGVVRDPPPCVDTTPQPSKPGLTQRMVAETRLANQSCTGCHSKFEPLAFGLERFDGIGSFREKDEFGNELREDGNILFPGQGQSIGYKSSAELMDLLAASDRVRETITWKVTQFALSRPLGAEDAAAVTAIHREAQKQGGTYQSLMTAIVTSDLVLRGRTESTDP